MEAQRPNLWTSLEFPPMVLITCEHAVYPALSLPGIVQQWSALKFKVDLIPENTVFILLDNSTSNRMGVIDAPFLLYVLVCMSVMKLSFCVFS